MKAKILFLILLLALAGCRQDGTMPTQDASFLINVRYEPDPPIVGEGIVVVILRDSGGFPIDNATLFVRGDMTHAGMTPVEVEFADSADGEYRVPINWNMAGDWVLTVHAVLADGASSEVQFNVSVGA